MPRRQTGLTLFDTLEPTYRCKDCGKALARPEDRFPEYGQCLACNHAEVDRFLLDWLADQERRPDLTDDQRAKVDAWRRWIQEGMTTEGMPNDHPVKG